MATGTITKVIPTSGSGYCKMPDGTLIQWGSDTKTSGYSGTVEFAMNFVNTNYVAIPVISTTGNTRVNGITNHSGDVYISVNTAATASVPITYYAIAIGRWK